MCYIYWSTNVIWCITKEEEESAAGSTPLAIIHSRVQAKHTSDIDNAVALAGAGGVEARREAAAPAARAHPAHHLGPLLALRRLHPEGPALRAAALLHRTPRRPPPGRPGRRARRLLPRRRPPRH